MKDSGIDSILLASREQMRGSKEAKDFFMSDNLAIVPYFNVPFHMDVAAISLISKGKISGTCNLLPLEIEAPAFTCFFPSQIIEYHHISEDAEVKLIALSTEFATTLKGNKSYNAYMYFKEAPVVKLTEEELRTLQHFFLLLQDVEKMADEDIKKEIVRDLFRAFFDIATHLEGYKQQLSQQKSHKEEVFEKFYKAVIEHHREARDVAYYADLLCITPRYLGRIVKEVTGKNAADWINEYVVLEAKSLLRTHLELSLLDITDYLGFPNQSFFGKLFKRYTGTTPKSYREEGNS